MREVIIATNPSMEGDATALYLQQRILPLGIKVSRLARGLPVGGILSTPTRILCCGRWLEDKAWSREAC